MKSVSLFDNKWIDFLFLIILIGFINFSMLGAYPLFIPDESRYAEIAREMLSTHQFVIPHLNGVIYLEKPPLSYWINALVMALFGNSEWAVRSMDAVLGDLTCLIIYFTALKLYNRRIAILSALILSSCLLHFILSHLVTTDMPLTFFLTTSLCCFLLSLHLPVGMSRNTLFCLAYLFSGLAIMTKGLIGIVLPGLIIGVWIVLTRQWQVLKKMQLWLGTFIVLSIALPWLIVVQKEIPGFLHFYFIEQQVARYAMPIADREMSVVMYCFAFFLALFPWGVWLPQSITAIFLSDGLIAILQKMRCRWSTLWVEFQSKSCDVYLLIWSLAIFLFFSASHSILVPYLLPTLPPISILIAQYFDKYWHDKLNKSQRISVILLVIVQLTTSIGCILYPSFHDTQIISNTYQWLSFIELIVAISSGVMIFISVRRGSMRHVFIAILLPTYLFLILLLQLIASGNELSVKSLAVTIKTLLKDHPNALVVNYGNYEQDLPYYLDHLVTIVDWQNELSFGFNHQSDAKYLLIDKMAFKDRWFSNQHLYVVMRQRYYQDFCSDAKQQCHLIKAVAGGVLITNKNLA